MPDTAPLLERFSWTALSPVPEVTKNVYPLPDPPLAPSVAEYAVPSVPFGRLVVVTVRPGLIVTDRLAVAVSPAESVTFTAKLAVPAVGVAPDRTPPLDKLSPRALRLLLPEGTVHVKPVLLPPLALSICEYATPADPFGRLVTVTVSTGYTTVSVSVADAVFPAESVTCTTNVPAVSSAVGVPVTAPLLKRLSPTALSPVPEFNENVYPLPDPPLALSLAEYDVPTVPMGSVEGEIVSAGVAMAIVNFTAAVRAGEPESVKVTVKLTLPATVGTPVIAPVAALRLSPGGNKPCVTDHL
jgi:hypothetical protein